MNSIKFYMLTTMIFLASWRLIEPKFTRDNFIGCMSSKSSYNVVHVKDSPLYPSLLQKSQQNPRWQNSTSALKPHYIITPSQESHVVAAVLCSKDQGLLVRVRSGGHDYEGLSYLSRKPFILIDLINLRQITIDVAHQTAWVQSGTTLGELYYSIAQESNVLGFPAGVCPTVGVGGHISGGGFGALTRKHGLAADHVADARLVDVNGRVLDRNGMGKELFWAIRGGGGASFGIITAWKLNLVSVPSRVTVLTVHRSIEQGGSKVVDRWQRIADKLTEDLFIRVLVQSIGEGYYGGMKSVQASFQSLFLGGIQSLIPIMKQNFPELGVEAKDCTEMSWIESVLYFAGHSRGTPQEVLLERDHQLYKSYFKAKSDFVTRPIPEPALRQAWERLSQVDTSFMIFEPLGGIMSRISATQTAFPHRKGNLYNIQYLVKWKVNQDEEAKKHIRWIRMLYDYMSPYVSGSPRAAYFNYRDLDLGINGVNGSRRYLEAKVWGTKYFKNNFERLAKVKSKVDPSNFFRDEQSIPPFDFV